VGFCINLGFERGDGAGGQLMDGGGRSHAAELLCSGAVVCSV
jgi:hypothetical protein